MTIDNNPLSPPRPAFPSPISQCVLTVIFSVIVMGLALTALPANAVGALAQVDIIDRHDGRLLPVYTRDGVHWIEGTAAKPRENARWPRNWAPGTVESKCHVHNG